MSSGTGYRHKLSAEFFPSQNLGYLSAAGSFFRVAHSRRGDRVEGESASQSAAGNWFDKKIQTDDCNSVGCAREEQSANRTLSGGCHCRVEAL
ncbi:unnamed protein product [Nippostrongylus brasiliensis]|uniref:Uncharacterized protein n=1 Tax=Nippostrongylus brasiliensis TaxID=27835 RepID=A0A0N4YFB0_NIPBR|nr:unnamed protein product [Nippostrongylus brasiliensis]